MPALLELLIGGLVACELQEVAARTLVIVACVVAAKVEMEVFGNARVPADIATDVVAVIALFGLELVTVLALELLLDLLYRSSLRLARLLLELVLNLLKLIFLLLALCL